MYKIQLEEEMINKIDMIAEAYSIGNLFTKEIVDFIYSGHKQYEKNKNNSEYVGKLVDDSREKLLSMIDSNFSNVGQKMPANVLRFKERVRHIPRSRFFSDMLSVITNDAMYQAGEVSPESEYYARQHSDDASNYALGGSRVSNTGKAARGVQNTSAGELSTKEFHNTSHSAGMHEPDISAADEFEAMIDGVGGYDEFVSWVKDGQRNGTLSITPIPLTDPTARAMATSLIEIYTERFSDDKNAASKAKNAVLLMYNNGKKDGQFKQFNGAYAKYFGTKQHNDTNEGVNYMLSKDIFNQLVNEADDLEVNLDADLSGDTSNSDEIEMVGTHDVGVDDSSYFVKLANDIIMHDERYSMDTLQKIWEKKGTPAIEHIYVKVVGEEPSREEPSPVVPDALDAEEQNNDQIETQDDELERLVKLSR